MKKFYSDAAVRNLGKLPEGFRYGAMEFETRRIEEGTLDSVYRVTLTGTRPASTPRNYLRTPLVFAAMVTPALCVLGIAGLMVEAALMLMAVAVITATTSLTTREKGSKVKCRFDLHFPCDAYTRDEKTSLKTLREAFAHNPSATYDALHLLDSGAGPLPDEVASRARAAITALAEQGERHRNDAARPEVQQAYAKLHQLEAAVDLEQ